MFWAIEGLVFISPGECLAKRTWDSLVVSTNGQSHARTKSSSSGRDEHTHAIFDVNDVQKKWIMDIITDELSINKIKSAVI